MRSPPYSAYREAGWQPSAAQLQLQMMMRSNVQAGPGTPPAAQRLHSHFSLSPDPSIAPDCTEGFLELPSECMDVCSAPSSAGPPAVCPPAGSALLETLAAAQTGAAVGLVTQCSLAGSWPTGLSPEACVFAACKLQQAAVVEALLAAGAPVHFIAVRFETHHPMPVLTVPMLRALLRKPACSCGVKTAFRLCAETQSRCLAFQAPAGAGSRLLCIRLCL